MSEPFEEDGYIWAPGSEVRSSARVRFDADHETTLTLINAAWARETGERWDVLHGESLWGAPWSLFDVRCLASEHWPGGNNSRSSCEAATLITGIHAGGEAEIAFTDLALRCHGMREWLTHGRPGRPSALTRPEDALEDLWGLLNATAGDVELLFHVSAVASGDRYRRHSEATAVLQLRSPTPLSLPRWLEQWVTQVQDLMVFGMRNPSSTISLSAIHAGVVVANGVRRDVKLYKAWPPRVEALPWAAYNGRALLPANAVADVGELLTRWFALHNELGDAAQFLFGTINDRDLPAVNRMLNLLAFAETYHRRKHDEPPVTEEEHDAFCEAMLGALPSKQAREVYAGRLRHANAQSQRQRMRSLVARAASADPRLNAVKRALVDSLIETRNHLTHFDPPGVWVSETPYGYALLAAALEFVLEANILLDLDLTPDEVRECLAHGHAWDDPIPALPTDEAPGRVLAV